MASGKVYRVLPLLHWRKKLMVVNLDTHTAAVLQLARTLGNRRRWIIATMEGRIRVLFVCMGNCVRSQMAEALARHHVADVLDSQSAGLRPLGFIDPTARRTVEERGISMEGQFSKGLHDQSLYPADIVINMSGVPGISVSFFHGRVFEDWPIGDPFGEDMETHGRICDDIEARIRALAARFRARGAAAPTQ